MIDCHDAVRFHPQIHKLEFYFIQKKKLTHLKTLVGVQSRTKHFIARN